MAGRKGHKLMEFSVPEDVRDILLKASIEKDTDVAPALSAIVREWAEMKEIDPLKGAPNRSDSEHLHKILRKLDARLDAIERNLLTVYINTRD